MGLHALRREPRADGRADATELLVLDFAHGKGACLQNTGGVPGLEQLDLTLAARPWAEASDDLLTGPHYAAQGKPPQQDQDVEEDEWREKIRGKIALDRWIARVV